MQRWGGLIHTLAFRLKKGNDIVPILGTKHLSEYSVEKSDYQRCNDSIATRR